MSFEPESLNQIIGKRLPGSLFVRTVRLVRGPSEIEDVEAIKQYAARFEENVVVFT
ncbi:MAG: hypothetical protein HXY38_16265 [Chloroflexi bacterium]|nr:hypothetical protein [Chloroflexota bacterium]